MKWPDPELFPYVDRVWKHDSKLLDIQYWRLVQRLQSFYRTTRGKQQWGSVKGYRVIAVSVQEGRTAAALRKKLTQCGADQLTASVLCGLTSAFVAGEQPRIFRVCGSCSKTGVCQRKTWLAFEGQPVSWPRRQRGQHPVFARDVQSEQQSGTRGQRPVAAR